ncbi:MAG TPA: helix-turn-helix transcriptional regulator [Stellaceae bacterium]|nr:helix-turn-helix transcriptional regulator [Stellaceae bacterium]
MEHSPSHASANPFLLRVGEKVRTLRNRRGMTRRALAAQAEVSERYLAQLETGSGNCSIALLRRIADAVSVPIAELVDDRERPIETMLLVQMLERLCPSQIVEARELLLSRFGGTNIETRSGRIALIGLRGAGKSTLGRMLAERLGVPFIELDRTVEQQSGMALAELFEMLGQATFRRVERTALETILHETPRFVLATGGGLVTEPGTFELLIASCLTIWLRATPQEHMARVIGQGDLRPMAGHKQAMDDLVSILASREPLYGRADLTLDTAGQTPHQSLAELLALLGGRLERQASRVRGAKGGSK